MYVQSTMCACACTCVSELIVGSQRYPQHLGSYYHTANHCCSCQHFCKPATHKQDGAPFFKYAVETLGMLNLYRVGGACPKFVEKTFTDGTQTVKFENVSPSKVSAIIITYKSISRPSHIYSQRVKWRAATLLSNLSFV